MIKMYTTPTCSDCKVTKMHLDRMGIDFQEIDITEDESAAEYVMSVNDGKRSVPTLVVAGGQATSLSRFERSRLDEFLLANGLLEERN